jgi:hypothetical protein
MGDDQFGPNQDTIQIQQRVAQLGRQRQELIEREYEAAAASGGGKKGGVRGQSSPSDFVVVGGDKHGHGAALVPTVCIFLNFIIKIMIPYISYKRKILNYKQ